ncbi:MAG: hypothetical protein E4H36_00395 [Spirochaetales bacterium]|nr:MAG: hypothetical protein E4H36_00395 [Spirochaetales bacterium]
MFGIDAGGTFIKFGDPREGYFEMFALPYTKEWVAKHMTKNTPPLLVTGAGSHRMTDWFPEKHIEIVPELMATGLGGAHLSGLDTCVVLNIGSGTPVLLVDRRLKKVVHVSGTGLGSASLAGLAYFMTGITDLDQIEREALLGDPESVTLLISDIYPNPGNLGLPGDVTASNFGKYQSWRINDIKIQPKREDLLAGLHRMVGETLAVIGSLACKTCAAGCEDGGSGLTVVVTGGGTLNKALCRHISRTFEYLNQPFVIPDKAEYSTLHGLFVYKDLL